MTEHKSALIVAPMPTHPQTQGNRHRLFEVCTHLKNSGYSVHFIWHAREWGGAISPAAHADMVAAWDQVHVVPMASSDNNRVSNGLDELCSDSLIAMVDWCRQNYSYQLVIANYVLYSKLLDLFAEEAAVRVIDTHDVLGNRHDMLEKAGATQQFYSLSHTEETRGLIRADIVLAIQEEDAHHFKSLGAPSVMVLGHMGKSHTPTSIALPPIAGIIGSFNNTIIDNANRFIARLAKYESRLPNDFRVLLAGSMCDGLTGDYPAFVQKLGRIENTDLFYRQIAIAIIPMDFGSGLKIKTIEALSYGLPVMGTKHAFIGIDTPHSEHQYADIDDLASGLADAVRKPENMENQAAKSAQVFAANKTQVQRQMDSFLAMVTANYKERLKNTPAFTLDILAYTDNIYLYGAGVGCQILLNAISPTAKKHIRGILDSFKSGLRIEELPVTHWSAVPESFRENALIILTVTSPDWRKIRDDLSANGFGHVISADRFIRARIT